MGSLSSLLLCLSVSGLLSRWGACTVRGSHTHNILGSHLRAAAIGGRSRACGATETVAQTGWPVRLDGMLDKGQRWRFGEGARCKSPERLDAAGISRCPSYRLPPTTQRYGLSYSTDKHGIERDMGTGLQRNLQICRSLSSGALVLCSAQMGMGYKKNPWAHAELRSADNASARKTS
ncbi:hypothetical protein OIDMADRAFT_29024 [Oidiodendron maius Zn]|uniref:Uncharacterized protein n=1 Tax=Oidiodendron maius (strain Zn) TaxID=913774 RepID=A0A0C3GZD2_OIDMZ|nr:hypothetical protein OIDMADRAFT_29024 [Oidiodendron maius Zn]